MGQYPAAPSSPGPFRLLLIKRHETSTAIYDNFFTDFLPSPFLPSPFGFRRLNSGKKKEPKPKLFGPDIFRWGGCLTREGVGAKKFGMSLETREIRLFGRDIPGVCRDIPAVPEKFEKKKFVFNSRPL